MLHAEQWSFGVKAKMSSKEAEDYEDIIWRGKSKMTQRKSKNDSLQNISYKSEQKGSKQNIGVILKVSQSCSTFSVSSDTLNNNISSFSCDGLNLIFQILYISFMLICAVLNMHDKLFVLFVPFSFLEKSEWLVSSYYVIVLTFEYENMLVWLCWTR